MLAHTSVYTASAPATASTGSLTTSRCRPTAAASSRAAPVMLCVRLVALRRTDGDRRAQARRQPASANAPRCCRRQHRRDARSRRSPKCSCKVSMSAIAWQGCSNSLSALITGMDACCAMVGHGLVRERPQHHAIDPALQVVRHIAQALARAQPRLRLVHKERYSAQAVDARLERQPRAQRRLLEEQHNLLADQRAAVVRTGGPSSPPPVPARRPAHRARRSWIEIRSRPVTLRCVKDSGSLLGNGCSNHVVPPTGLDMEKAIRMSMDRLGATNRYVARGRDRRRDLMRQSPPCRSRWDG